jgi:hypothetical protein
MKVLQASRDALSATRQELDALRALVESRDDAVVQLLDGRLAVAAKEDTVAALTAAVEALAAEQSGLKRALSVKLESMAGSLESVDFRTQEALSALTERVGSLERGLHETVLAVSGELASSSQREEALAAMLDDRLSEIAHVFDARQQEVADAILKALDPVGRIMQLVQARLARAASDLAVAQGSLLARLVERDDRLERQRDATLAELLNEFAGTIKPRDRGRIGAGLLEADEERRRRRDFGKPPTTGYAPGPDGGADPPGSYGTGYPPPTVGPGESPPPAGAGDPPRSRRGRKPAL